MNSPLARRIPVFTAAPLPLLYGCRTTHAPAVRARAAVSSVEPSSTTRISCHEAASRSEDTTAPIASASFMAGMTIEIVDGSAKKLLDDAVPRDRPCHMLTCVAEPFRKRAIGGQFVDRHGDGRRLRFTHEAVRALSYEFERAAGISGRDHGFRREK